MAVSKSVLIVIINPTELEPVVIVDDNAGDPNEDVVKGEEFNHKDLKKEVDKITLILAPKVGPEPTTLRLRVSCSTD